jgi:hypothetical protein
MSGLEAEPFAGLTDNEVVVQLNSGWKTLQSRGLLTIQEDAIVLSDTIVALVGTSVYPEASFLLSEAHRDGTTKPHYFNASAYLVVEHSSPRPGIYQFDQLADGHALAKRVQAILAGLQGLPPTRHAILPLTPDSTLSQVLQHCWSNDSNAGRTRLVEVGWLIEDAEAFVADAMTATVWVGTVGWGLRQELLEGSSTTMVLQGVQQAWIIQQVAQQPDMLSISAVDERECQAVLLSLLTPIQNVLREAVH